MPTTVQMDPDWLEKVLAATDRLFEGTLGPEISDDARDMCPVFGGQNSTATASSLAAAGDDYDPGALQDSIEFHLNAHSLIVSATGSDERTYAAWVELGHRVVAWSHDMGYSKPPQPFLRPALFAVRTA
jgi:hypothetical protein